MKGRIIPKKYELLDQGNLTTANHHATIYICVQYSEKEGDAQMLRELMAAI